MEENFKVQLGLAASLVKKKLFDQAIVTLKSLDESYDESELVLGMLAGTYAQIGMHSRAEEYFRRTLSINPINGLARIQLGLVLVTLGRNEEALTAWKPLLNEDNDFMGHFHSGITLLEMGETERASELLEIAKARIPIDHPYRPKLEELSANYSSESYP